MAFKLTKTEIAEKDQLHKKLQSEKSALDSAVEDANRDLGTAQDRLNDQINHYNVALAAVREFVETHRNTWQEEFDAKSSTWQEGEKGEAAAELLGEWDNYDAEDVEQIEISGVEVEAEHAEAFEGLPVEAGE